jgi:AraC family transcriptional regulator
MYQTSALSIATDGSREVPMPSFAPGVRGIWSVQSLAVVHSWSAGPTAYGTARVFTDGFAITLSLTPTRRRTTVNGAVIFEGWTPAGAMRVQRPGDHVSTEMFTPFEQVSFYIPTAVFQSILQDQGPSDIDLFDIAGPLWRVDAVIDANLRAAVLAIESRSKASCYYLNSMAHLIATHVLHRYGHDPHRTMPWDDVDVPELKRVFQFIDANIDKTLSLADMAVASGLSIDRFRRDFKASTQMSPHQYVIRRRVDRAREMLISSRSPRLSDIALACGFADQSHLSTTFRRVLGISPARFARQPSSDTPYLGHDGVGEAKPAVLAGSRSSAH